jgi:hypothetical protein
MSLNEALDYRPSSLRIGTTGLVITGVLVTIRVWDAPIDWLSRIWRVFDGRFVEPCCFLLVCGLGVLSLIFFFEGCVYTRRRRRFQARTCQRCRYDLSRHDLRAACPECGLPAQQQLP